MGELHKHNCYKRYSRKYRVLGKHRQGRNCCGGPCSQLAHSLSLTNNSPHLETETPILLLSQHVGCGHGLNPAQFYLSKILPGIGTLFRSIFLLIKRETLLLLILLGEDIMLGAVAAFLDHKRAASSPRPLTRLWSPESTQNCTLAWLLLSSERKINSYSYRHFSLCILVFTVKTS